jgi:hypothetical protein
MPPPAALTTEQADAWRELVGASAPERFGPDARPVLLELVRAMSVSRQIAEQLAALRERPLTSDTKAGAATRRTFLQLAAVARDQARLIGSLSVKLRLAEQTKTRKAVAAAESERSPAGPRPWDSTERSN